MTDFLLRHAWPLLAGVAVKSLFVLACAALGAFALRRASAAARNLLWTVVLVSLLLLPLLSNFPAIWQIPLAPRALLVPADAPVVTNDAPESHPASPQIRGGAGLSPPLSEGGGGEERAGGGFPSIPPELGAVGRTSLPWQVWACVLWLLGFALTLAPTVIGLIGVRRLARRSLPVSDGPILELTVAFAKEFGVTQPVRLLIGDMATPMTWGWLRPVILLPIGAEDWPADRLRAVLLHELAHIARADWPTQMVAYLTCAVYWFNPLVWLAARQARIEGERACDDRVLLAGVSASDYARHLLDVARSLRDRPLHAVLPMAQASGVEGRLKAILQMNNNRQMMTRQGLWFAGGGALLVLLALAVIQFGSAGMPFAVAGIFPLTLAWQAPLPKGTTVAPPSQEVTLPDGIQVKLLGFAQNPSRHIPWSTPDGRAGIKSPYLSANATYNSPSERSVEFAVSMDGLRQFHPGVVNFATMTAPKTLGGGTNCNIITYEPNGNSSPSRNLQAILTSFPKSGRGDQTGAFLFGVASGPWETVVTKQFTNGINTSTMFLSGNSVLISTSQDVRQPLIVSVADDFSQDVQTQIVAIDRHGVMHTPKELGEIGNETTSINGVHSFNQAVQSYHNIHQSLVTFPGLPLRDVREVRFQTRPYQWVLFQNLALYPIITRGVE
jgi:beta-lactamase regulating signal transducer with metallopeptidase domain